MGATVLQVGALPAPLAEALTAKYGALVLPPISTGRADFLAEHAGSVRAIVDAAQAPVDAELMGALPNLGAIIHYLDGYDTIDIDAARRLGICIKNTAVRVTDAGADTAVGLMLMTMRGFGAAERYVRAGRWLAEGPYPLTEEVTGARVGILGLGHIGSAIARRLSGFNCAIAYHNRHELPGSGYQYAPSVVDLAKSVEVLEALGPDGYLINIARGSVVDEKALVDLLVRGQLAGAGLDVVAHEPTVPQQLRESDNVVVLPHVGAATARTRTAMTTLTLRNLDEYLTHGTLTTPVIAPTR